MACIITKKSAVRYESAVLAGYFDFNQSERLKVIVGFFLLIGLANKPEQVKDSVKVEDTK